MDDKDATVAAAAMKAAAKLAPGEILKLLTARMKSTEHSVIEAARELLAGIEAEGFNEALAAAMPDASPPGKVALLELLAARGATAQSKVVFDALGDGDPTVREAAVKALAGVAAPADVDRTLALMLAAADEGQRNTIQNVVVSLCRKGPGAKCVLDALAKADAKQRPLLLATLGRIGGSNALDAVMKDLDSTDTAIKDAAARALADWQGTEALEPLAKFAGQTDSEVHRVLAIRGMVRLVGRDQAIPADKAVDALCHALAAAKKPAEKSLVIGALGGIRSIESLKLVAGCLDDADVRELAAAAAVKIACPANRREKGLTGPDVRKALGEVVSVSKTPRVVEEAKKYLATMDKGK
jgi:HEAT repeat protein